MTLSVIIVSYNVKYFLEQCLCSVQRALDNDMEVIVTDNNSSDGSVEYLQQRFPFVRFISNKENLGFARANNQALQVATGKYVLFLNPDTIIPEDLFVECIDFMDSNADAGAMGVRMVDGGGRFLKESKRGFPTPWVAFCKMTGLTKLFPRSESFARYYMGHLSEKHVHEVDALAGACMLVRKEVLDKTGGFDEQYFMYAEDIDLSYRIQQAGYKNYYFPQTPIIHFKGESTRKDKHYVYLFYKAMIQFARKHFRKNRTLEAAIHFRAWLASLGSGKKSALTSSNASGHYRFSSMGDKQAFGEFPLGEAGSKQEAIVFCEGGGHGFKQLISLLENLEGGKKIFFHGQGTNSAVGSTDSNGLGEVIYW
jgi:N-acetylglucosaminyl-diphospho-decaprenol L-rhamnosyltransferase